MGLLRVFFYFIIIYPWEHFKLIRTKDFKAFWEEKYHNVLSVIFVF